MALTLVESAKLSTDLLHRGVIETIIEDSPILRYLPFLYVEGNSFKYSQENTLGGAQFYAVNGTWAEGTATFTQKTAGLSILGGDADVDNFIQRTRSNLQDQQAIQVVLKAKDVARKWEETVVVGDVGVDANSFDGIRKLTVAGQTIAAGANGGALTLALIDEVIDRVRGGKPHLLVMSRRTRRKLKSLHQASTHYIEVGSDQFGRQVMFYDGIPVEVSDWIPDNEVKGTSGAVCSSIYAIYFSPADGLTGLTNGGIEVVNVGPLETKDASRVRIRWYTGLALLRDTAISRIEGITAA